MKRRKDPPSESWDPMVLWVGTWMPEDVIDRETREISEAPASEEERPDG